MARRSTTVTAPQIVGDIDYNTQVKNKPDTGSGVSLSDDTPSENTAGQSGSAGTGTEASRDDHEHATPQGLTLTNLSPTVSTYGGSSAVGSSTGAAKADHKHGLEALPANPDLSDYVKDSDLTGKETDRYFSYTNGFIGSGYRTGSGCIFNQTQWCSFDWQCR